jgi:hypothetical protein
MNSRVSLGTVRIASRVSLENIARPLTVIDPGSGAER